MQAQNSGNPAGFSEIHTGRLILRALEEKDARRIFQYRSHPEVSRFQSWGTKSSAEVQSHIKKLSATPRGTPGFWHQLGICLLANGNLIGDCGFHVLEAEPRQAECGITLDPSHQGHGYATEALRGLLDYLFFTLGKHRVFGSVDPQNIRSIKLMERVGLRKEAHFVQSLWLKGAWVDDLIYAMLAGEWKTTRGTQASSAVRNAARGASTPMMGTGKQSRRSAKSSAIVGGHAQS
jgi:RimJ/RimL family protein N-acetyltransferase